MKGGICSKYCPLSPRGPSLADLLYRTSFALSVGRKFLSIGRRFRRRFLWTSVALSLSAGGCNYGGNVSGLHYLLDMHDSPALEAQEEDYSNNGERATEALQGMDAVPARTGRGSGLRVPPEGAIPRNYEPYPYEAGDFGAAKALRNILPRSRAVLQRGQQRYNIFCAVCHGYTGLGDGPVTPQVANVPSLMAENIKTWSEGELFHIITMGRGRMLPYAAQISANDRWAIIHYLRLLQQNSAGTAEAAEAAGTTRVVEDAGTAGAAALQEAEAPQ